MSNLIRDAFMSARPQTQAVPFPEFNLRVRVRELKSSEVTEFFSRQKESEEAAIAYLLATAVKDDQGNAVFTQDDRSAIADFGFSLTNRLVDPILKLSGLRETPAEKKPDASGSPPIPAN